MHPLRTGFLIAALVLMFVPAVSAAEITGSADDMFALGTEAFGEGRYEAALQYFQAAGESGMDSAALHYNLGVTYFRLERYTEARQVFEQLAASPGNAPLAHYNLGRIALARGDRSAALNHFETTARTAKDPKLRTLARNRIDEMASAPEEPMWSGFLSLAGGYDDNVSLIADSEVLVGDVEDEFWEFIGAVNGQLYGTRDNGLQLKSTGYYQDYLDANEFDFGDFRIGPEIDREFGQWNTSLAAYADWAYLDRDLFEQIFSVEIRGSRAIYENVLLRLEYELGVIDAESPYEDLTGNRHRLSADLRSVIFGAYTGIGYTLELNDRDDEDFPTRHSVGFLVDKDLTDVWAAGINGSYRYSDYQETDRQDDRLWLSARVSREIPWDFEVFGKYDYIRNYSNTDENEYTSNVFFFGIERFF